MGKQRAIQTQVKSTRKSTTAKVGEDMKKCGRWVLRQTKIRQARVSEQITCKAPSKDLGKRRKRQPPSQVPKEESCVGDNGVPVQPALLPTYPPWLGHGLVGGAYGTLGAGYGGAGFGPQPALLPTYPPWLDYGLVGGAYGGLGAGYGGAGFGQPMMCGPTPIIYGTTPGMTMMPMLPDGRTGYDLQQPRAQGPAPPPPQQSSSTGGSSTGGSSSS